jgi:uncharacterized cupredoxin-like copper-binding protein
VTFVVSNPSAMQHQLAAEGNGVNAKRGNLEAGTTNTFTLKGLKAGECQIVCNHSGHEEAGMSPGWW